MKTLFIDSSRKSLSIALANENKLLFVSNINSYSKHSNYLMNEIKNIISNNNLVINDIDNIVVLNGPGSFTGIRVGVTIAKTLAWALNKKLYQLNNLIALKIGNYNDVVISVIPDKPSHSYVGIYESSKKVEEYLSIDNDLLNIHNKNITIVCMEQNEFVIELKARLEKNNSVEFNLLEDYNYLEIISLVLQEESINPHLAEPIYLKKIDAEKQNGN